MAAASSSSDRFEWLVVAAVVTAAATAVPPWAAGWVHGGMPWLHAVVLDAHLDRANFDALFALAFGGLLVLPHPVRAGLVPPDLRRAKWRTAAVCLACVGVAVAFNRRLDVPQLRGTGGGYWMWLIGPPAQDLIFAGFLFGKFAQLWPGPVARWVPIDRAVVLSAVYCSLWHAQNFQTVDAAVVPVQMLYTLAGGLALGLTRQWTGSILFVTLTHVAVNWLAWHDVGLAR